VLHARPCPANLATHLSLCLSQATCRLQPIEWHVGACLALPWTWLVSADSCLCTQDDEIRALQAEVARLRASQQPNVIKPKQVRTVCHGLSADTQSLRHSEPHAACECSLVLILRAKHTAQAPAGAAQPCSQHCGADMQALTWSTEHAAHAALRCFWHLCSCVASATGLFTAQCRLHLMSGRGRPAA
jgi:hypothetical protein